MPPVTLIVKPDWCREIFDNHKVWELRGAATHRRGRIVIAASGGALIGEVDLVDCFKVGRFDRQRNELKPCSNASHDQMLFVGNPQNFLQHRIAELSTIQYPTVFAWVFENPVRYAQPLPRPPRRGAVIWVSLHAEELKKTCAKEGRQSLRTSVILGRGTHDNITDSG